VNEAGGSFSMVAVSILSFVLYFDVVCLFVRSQEKPPGFFNLLWLSPKLQFWTTCTVLKHSHSRKKLPVKQKLSVLL